eukprot:s2411_g8.t1
MLSACCDSEVSRDVSASQISIVPVIEADMRHLFVLPLPKHKNMRLLCTTARRELVVNSSEDSQAPGRSGSHEALLNADWQDVLMYIIAVGHAFILSCGVSAELAHELSIRLPGAKASVMA